MERRRRGDRLISIGAALYIMVILFTWWLTIKDGQRLIGKDRDRPVVYTGISKEDNNDDHGGADN